MTFHLLRALRIINNCRFFSIKSLLLPLSFLCYILAQLISSAFVVAIAYLHSSQQELHDICQDEFPDGGNNRSHLCKGALTLATYSIFG